MEDVFTCPKCNKEFDSDNPKCEARYYDNDEDDNGNHRWDVSLKCPFCNYDFWEEVWDEDFGE